MASITIKSLSPSLHRALKARAARHKRSLNQEITCLLEEGVVPIRRVNVETMIEQEKRFRNSLKLATSPREIDAFKRQGRP
jgi:antitoxin FitA